LDPVIFEKPVSCDCGSWDLSDTILSGTAFALLLLQGLVEFELGGSCFSCVINSIFLKTSGFLDESEVICPCSESRSLANSSPFSCYLALWF
jgi:hypothetical protein